MQRGNNYNLNLRNWSIGEIHSCVSWCMTLHKIIAIQYMVTAKSSSSTDYCPILYDMIVSKTKTKWQKIESSARLLEEQFRGWNNYDKVKQLPHHKSGRPFHSLELCSFTRCENSTFNSQRIYYLNPCKKWQLIDWRTYTGVTTVKIHTCT